MCYENGNLEILWDVQESLMDLGACGGLTETELVLFMQLETYLSHS